MIDKVDHLYILWSDRKFFISPEKNFPNRCIVIFFHNTHGFSYTLNILYFHRTYTMENTYTQGVPPHKCFKRDNFFFIVYLNYSYFLYSWGKINVKKISQKCMKNCFVVH